MKTIPDAFRAGDRAAFIASLRELAAFLEARPTIPVPYAPALICFTSADNDAATWDAVRYMGAALNVEPEHTKYGMTAVRRFGPIEFGTWAVAQQQRIEYEARLWAASERE